MKDIVVNQALPSLHGGSLEIKQTVSLSQEMVSLLIKGGNIKNLISFIPMCV